MYSVDNDFASATPSVRQRAIDYTRMQVELTVAVGGTYLLVVPGAVGRPRPYDGSEWVRSVDGLQRVADDFVTSGIQAAIEPIRRDEVSLVHSVSDAIQLIESIGSEGIQHINGDVYHMQASEPHIGAAILEAGPRLTNLHLADSNRGRLGSGSMDLDTIIRALYLIGHNSEGRFVTPEPLGPGASPYDAMWGSPNPDDLDELVIGSAQYFRDREDAVLAE
jgi:sugar phosphate isomerase/epimerase